MKAITKITTPLFLLIAIIWGCEDSDKIIGETIYNGPSFLRFYLITNSNGEPIGEGDRQIGKEPSEELVYHSLKPLKIPVSLTYPGLNKDISADYTYKTAGDFSDFTIEPTSKLNFSASNLYDTITVYFNQRWESGTETTINFELATCSDNTVSIGHLNNLTQNKTLAVSLGDVYTTATFSSNRIEITGKAGEQVEFEVLLDNGFLPEEIEGLNLFNEAKGFEYTLEKVIEDGNYESIKYIMTLTEDIQNDDVEYISTLKINEETPYHPTGNSTIQIVKPLNIPRDNAVFTASNFYNLNDPYYRIYGENWMWHSTDQICKWVAWNAFAYPVVVDKSHPNAVLYSNNGTPEEDDDIYHHAFQVGFNSREPERTIVNSFNLRRWFNNASSNPGNSPGFNITKAMEFYPKDGVSETEGTVLVISQNIIIRNLDGKKYEIAISGNGTYSEISSGLFEIILTFKAYNEELFGGTQISYYRMYNNSSYGGDPEPLNEGCIDVIDL